MDSLRRLLCFIAAATVFNCLPVYAQSSQAGQSPATTTNSQGLSPDARQLAQLIGITDKLQQLADSAGNIQLRQELTEIVLTSMLEVRSAVGAIDVEIARADDLHAILERRRDKALKLTSIAQLLTGVFNGVTGNAMEVRNEKLTLPAQILEICDGATQTGLAAMALQQQRGEQHQVEPMGTMLARLFDKSGKNTDFTDIVWAFLNSVPPGDSRTRRDSLIDGWMKMGIIRKHSQTKWDNHLGHITRGSTAIRTTIDVLEDRDAMLHDLRAAVSEMDLQLLQIMRLIRRTH